MTIDQQISQDLAVVGRASRERPIALEATLRRVGVLRDPAPSSSSALTLLRLSRVYSARVARTWAGVASLAVTTGLLVYTAWPRTTFVNFRGGLWAELFYGSVLWVAAAAVVIVLCVHLTVLRAAVHRFDRVVRGGDDPIATARRLVERSAGAAIGFGVVGATSFTLFFGLMFVTVGSWGVVTLFEPHDDPAVFRAVAACLVLSASSMAVSCAGSAVVARLRPRNPSLWIWLGAAIGLVTVVVGMRYDVGPLHVTITANDVPWIPLRAGLTVTGTIGVFLAATGIVMRLHRHEETDVG